MKVLLLTSPNVSLQYTDDPVLLAGTTEVLGDLEHFGNQVDYFDLNARLNQMNKPLSESDKKTLLDIEFLKDPDYKNPIFKLAKELLLDIKIDEYDEFAISVLRWSAGQNDLNFMILHFAAILSMLLPKKTFLGGNLIFKSLSEKYIKKIVELPNSNIQSFLSGEGRGNFSKFLSDPDQKRTSVVRYPNEVNFDIRPSFNVKNTNDLKLDFDRTFSEEIQEKYQIKKYDFIIAPFRFSKGCIFQCSFCGTSRPVHYMDPSKVVDYLEYWHDNGVVDFRFYNDNINFKQKFLFSFCDEIVKRNLKIFFSDSANLLLGSKDIYSALAEAGCVKLYYGAETFSPRLLNIIRKNNKEEKVREFIHLAHDKNIFVYLNTIVNFPYETEEDFNMTYRFLEDMKHIIDAIDCNIFYIAENSDYSNNPEKYDITISRDSYFAPTWSENSGLQKWEDIQNRGKIRQKKLYDIFHAQVTQLVRYDNIIHTLRRQFNKIETKEIMIEMSKNRNE